MRIWLIGMYGAVATTAIVGAKALEHGITHDTGLVSSLPQFKKLNEILPLEFEFGGHEVRSLSFNAYQAALEHWNLNHHYDFSILEAVKEDIISLHAEKGTAINCGSGISEFEHIETLESSGYSLQEIVDKILSDMKHFKNDDTVVMNVASTEPTLQLNSEYHYTIDGFERMIDEDRKEYATASMLYAYAALKLGIPYGNFTPSCGSSIPALKKLAIQNGVPHAGNDGKTGETLVKTILAPTFAYRHLKVLGWAGFNILGDYDGRVLHHKDNKESKIKSKDKVIRKILGYNPYTITEIRFFPSLVDNKMAFNLIHFEGFLGGRMKIQFTWDAIDAIVAAPLVLDIARFLAFAKRKGLAGVIKELAFFFKSPLDTEVYNTHQQFEILNEWYWNTLKHSEHVEKTMNELK